MNKEFREFLEDELYNVKKMNEDILSGYGAGVNDSYAYILKKYDEFHKPVVIPDFVADWIEDIKPNKSLRVAFEYIAQRKRDNHDDELAFWVEEGNSETFARALLDGYEVEEEPLYYALIKVHELMNSGNIYWIHDKSDDSVFISNLHTMSDCFTTTKMSKVEWNELGINDSIADFVEVLRRGESVV